MTTTKSQSARSANGGATPTKAAQVKEAGSSVATAASKAKGPLLAAGATAAGLAGGLALGARMSSKPRGLGAILAPRRRILGVPVGPKRGVVKTAETLAQVAHDLQSASKQIALTTDDVREVREQLEHANRQSPVEVLLSGLTHRRGAHRHES